MNTETGYDKIKKLIEAKMSTSPKFKALFKRIESGKATFKDTAEYSRLLSELYSKTFSESVMELESASREEISTMLLHDTYDSTNRVLGQVQSSLDKKKNINIRPQKAPFPAERVLKFSHSLQDVTVPDSVIQRRARSGMENITMSFHDDYMKENAEFRSKAGLKCYITRTTDGTCCEWCTKVAGRYEFGSQPEDIFRRHDNCSCEIDYDGQKLRGEMNGNSKKWVEVPAEGAGAEPPKVLTRAESAVLSEKNKPVVFTQEQAQKLNNEKLKEIFVNKQSIDNSEISDIISLRDDNSLYKPVTQKAIDRIPKLDIFDDDEMNKRHQQAAKDLLTEVKKRDDVPVGTEFSIRYDKDMKPLKGEVYRQGEVGKTRFEDLGEPFHVFHNHGSGETFSLTDIQSFVDINNALSITAVGNNGNNYCLSRLVNNDRNAYGFFLRNKSRTTIYSVNGVNISLSKLSDSIEGTKLKPLIEKLSDEQKEDLTKAIISQIHKCLEGGAKYGFKYTESS